MSNQIVFTRAFNNNGGDMVQDIFSMNPDGTNQLRLTTNPPTQEWDCGGPEWSPDNQKIAFMSYLRRPGIDTSDIYVMDASGGNRQRLTDGPSDNEDPSWSPDGTRLVFTRWDENGDSSLYIMNADGTNLQRLTSSPYCDYSPSWGGDKIAFIRELGNAKKEVFVINADGTGEKQLTSYNTIIYDPTWMPDGSRVIFSKMLLASSKWEIYSVDSATGGSAICHTPAAGNYFSPAYSPAGDKIVMASDRNGGQTKLFVLDVGTGTLQQITSGPGEDNSPMWR